MKRFVLLSVIFFAGIGPALSGTNETGICGFDEARIWLENKTGSMLRACRSSLDRGDSAYTPQQGKECRAFVLRDFAYMLETGMIPDADAISAVKTFYAAINPRGNCVDYVKFDGTPVYSPVGQNVAGTIPLDGAPFFVNVVYLTWRQTKAESMLDKKMLSALVRAMNAIPHNPANGLVHIEEGKEQKYTPYGFTDAVRKRGDCLFESLLEIQASRRMAELLHVCGLRSEGDAWNDHADKMENSVNTVLWDSRRKLYWAATSLCREHDIWGSAFAVWLGVASKEQARNVAEVFRIHFMELTQAGLVRHLLPDVYWTSVVAPRDSGQNGGYWGIASGWFGYTLHLQDDTFAQRFFVSLVNGYRKRGVMKWAYDETVNEPGGYLAGAALPLVAMRRIAEENRRDAL